MLCLGGSFAGCVWPLMGRGGTGRSEERGAGLGRACAREGLSLEYKGGEGSFDVEEPGRGWASGAVAGRDEDCWERKGGKRGKIGVNVGREG